MVKSSDDACGGSQTHLISVQTTKEPQNNEKSARQCIGEIWPDMVPAADQQPWCTRNVQNQGTMGFSNEPD